MCLSWVKSKETRQIFEVMDLCGAKVTQVLGPCAYSEAPDGGWGWVVAAAFFIVEVFTYGFIKSFGIFLEDVMDEFEESNSRVSWVVSICVFVMTFNGPLSSVMTNRFGFQIVVMIGGLLISTGTIATSFTSSVNQMYITYGLVAGLGYCLTFLPTVTILSKYFTRRRSLVTAVASTGESFAMFALAPAFSALRDLIGWRHTMAVIGALQSIVIICGALLRPIIIKPNASQDTETDTLSSKMLKALGPQEDAEHVMLENSVTRNKELTAASGVQSDKDSSTTGGHTSPHKDPTESRCLERSQVHVKELEKTGRDAEEQLEKDGDQKLSVKNPLLDFSILRECSFIFYSLFGLFATLGFFAPQLYIIRLSMSRGVKREQATYMLPTMAVAEILGRFSIGWVLTRKPFRRRKLLVLLACVVIMTMDLVGFTLVAEFWGLVVCCGVYGFFMGTLACTHIPMLAEDDVVGIERMSSAAGVYVFIQSFAGLAGPPLGGVLVDVTQNYGAAFYSCAVGMGLSAMFLGLVKPAKRGFSCRRRSLKRFKCERNVCSQLGNGEQTQDQRPDRLKCCSV
ncbi:monocarboxylate transporter 7 isoform X3 [Nothobranchius furzeri]|uniref:Monocarboxylate transporter 7 n=1 Tax=Nothobranchius furzeri TaxID=105023 RepID=A0A9D2XP75_NOTFU|nr:monocarboxylate transporter 7 isoform X3 [Nothobranchius furzeri]KAF7204769.1 transcript variant X2 [Nothobranchius furzeri]